MPLSLIKTSQKTCFSGTFVIYL